MNIKQIVQTVAYLKPTQVYYQILKHIAPPRKTVGLESVTPPETPRLCTAWIPAPSSLEEKDLFTFIHLSAPFSSWNDTQQGMLWTYNLGYMDYLLQANLSLAEKASWVDRFVEEYDKITFALDPYPTSLRIINWIKLLTNYQQEIPAEKWQLWHNALYREMRRLEQNLEYHLLGNHLLENAYALYFAALYWKDAKRYTSACKLLFQELKRQTLCDGAHFEQSPMYQAILAVRLLDCVHMAKMRQEMAGDTLPHLMQWAQQMLGHLKSIIWQDGSIPLTNDSATDIAPTWNAIEKYAKELGFCNTTPIPLSDSGYRKLCNPRAELLIKDGTITASYQPGHTHADALHYLLRIDGKPIVVDTGISTYNKNKRRAYERSTWAHNTVTIQRTNSADVWGGFRVGHRPRVRYIEDQPNEVIISHNGLKGGAKHTRTWHLDSEALQITDNITSGEVAESFIHLSPKVSVLDVTPNKIITSDMEIEVDNASNIEILSSQVSQTYNSLQDTQTIAISFVHSLSYRIVFPPSL